jgi:hypothetical protein
MPTVARSSLGGQLDLKLKQQPEADGDESNGYLQTGLQLRVAAVQGAFNAS